MERAVQGGGGGAVRPWLGGKPTRALWQSNVYKSTCRYLVIVRHKAPHRQHASTLHGSGTAIHIRLSVYFSRL